jgi:hypothetical protein
MRAMFGGDSGKRVGESGQESLRAKHQGLRSKSSRIDSQNSGYRSSKSQKLAEFQKDCPFIVAGPLIHPLDLLAGASPHHLITNKISWKYL